MILLHMPGIGLTHSEMESLKSKKILNQLLDTIENELSCNNYSWRTIKSYRSHLFQFISYLIETSELNLNEQIIEQYLKSKQRQKKWSVSTQQQALNAILYYSNTILQKPLNVSNIRPKTTFKLPELLNNKELELVLNEMHNLKHRCMILLTYSSGLRLSELINLKLSDIKFNLNRILIRSFTKGPHYSILSPKILELLKQYIYEYDVSDWLFEGRNGNACSGRSVESMFKKFLTKLKIQKRITIQTLRHCFAVHLLESGLGIQELQSLMGHQSKKTTTMYLHLARKSNLTILSPLDQIQLKKFVNSSEIE
ncbi:MAG: tyrosine-type recombinase/integrase [Saprospiraceae bacterium]